ncbi:type II toxin-antitoxin system CcdA family antitoxin [Halomonas sp. DP8Y7-3]|uniref:type II toxin-antitoxin system CcdA family antitoxin n=1 Tax=Halomonas sp. DP8Y7-3 TaxID=2859079 RepID=UPI0039656EC7
MRSGDSQKATNHNINSDLPERVRNINVDLSARLEKALEAKLAESEAEQWQSEMVPSFRTRR